MGRSISGAVRQFAFHLSYSISPLTDSSFHF